MSESSATCKSAKRPTRSVAADTYDDEFDGHRHTRSSIHRVASGVQKVENDQSLTHNFNKY